MGEGYGYKCKKCRHRYSAHWGIGMLFSTIYSNILEDISEGEYGSEWQELYKNIPYAAVNDELVVFICNRCGSWKVSTDLSLYAPNDPESISQKRVGDKTDDVYPSDLASKYHLVKRYDHRCGKCGELMHKASSSELEALPCPKCGQKNHAISYEMWD